jgi:hypothetical protein
MIDPRSQTVLKKEIADRMAADRALLDGLRDEIRPLRDHVRPIQPRTITSISLVGTDGGNNRLRFDPFLVQVIRVVDSSNNEYCLEAVTPTTRISLLSAAQFDSGGSPRTALGEMMAELGVSSLTQLSHMIRGNEDDRPVSPSWVQVYRELVEWAILLSIVRNKEFGTDTLIVFDGLLRTKVFRGELFKRYRQAMDHAIERAQEHHRRIYLAGVAKHSQVLTRYRLAMSLEGILRTDYPGYVEIPRSIEEKAYIWSEYARGDDRELESGEVNKFVGGKMFFVKFGVGRRDPIWPVDIYLPQHNEAQVILGSLLADAVNGFPVPFYPQCLQRAHENAALVDFDLEILQDQVFDGIRDLLDGDAHLLDEFRLEDSDPSRGRYE